MKKKLKIKTADKHIIEVGDILYHVDNIWAPVKKFKVKAFHDGKAINACLINPLSYKNDYIIDIREYGGKGVYPEKEINPFSFFLVRDCYYSLQNARKQLKIRFLKLKKIYEKNLTADPIKYSRTHR